MHEMALMRDVLDTVLDQASRSGASRVTAVYVTIGDGRDVVWDLVESMFAYLARGTVAQDAELVIHRTPFMVQCDDCGMPFHLNVFDRATWRCPRCGAVQHYHLISGMEFTIDSIEVAPEHAPAAAKDCA